MPSDRLFRFSSCGLMFLGTSIFFFFCFGGTVDDFKEHSFTFQEGFNIFLSLFFGTPLVGIIISTITVKILFAIRGYRLYCYVPTEEDIIKKILKRYNQFPQLSGISMESSKWGRWKEVRKFYPFYQSEVRRIIDGERLKFLDRRWSAYWTQVNNVASIILALIFVFLLRLCSEHKGFSTLIRTHDTYKYFGLLVLILYFGLAIWHAIQSRKEGFEAEHIYLSDFYRNHKESQEGLTVRNYSLFKL